MKDAQKLRPEDLAIADYLKTFDTNENGRLDKTELPRFVLDRINAVSESEGHCRDFMRFAFPNEESARAATTKSLTAEMLKEAETEAIRVATKNTRDLLNSNVGKTAFPKGFDAAPSVSDLAPIGPAVVRKIKTCVEIPLKHR